jgi:hypothetical protein
MAPVGAGAIVVSRGLALGGVRQRQLLLVPRYGVSPPHRPTPLVELFAIEQGVDVSAKTDAESVSNLLSLGAARSVDPGVELNGVCDARPVSSSFNCCHNGHPIAALISMDVLGAVCRAIFPWCNPIHQLPSPIVTAKGPLQ